MLRNILKASLLVLCLTSCVTTSGESDLKSGWDEEKINYMALLANQSMVKAAEQSYYLAAKQAGNSNPKPFPKEVLEQSGMTMFVCIIRRTAITWEFSYVTKNMQSTLQKYVAEVANGGECAPKEGLLSAVLNK